MTIYLASASPRRKEILTQVGISFEICVSGANEETDVTDPARVVEELSIAKAQATQIKLSEEGVKEYCVIGADTVVACGDEILGKPADEKEAFEMLKKISGRDHQVYTGVTIIANRDGMENTLVTFHEETTVTMYEMTDEEILEYIATGDPLDKAGSYGIQARAAAYVKGIKGDFYNVVGLPIARLYHELCKLDIL